MLKHKTNFKKGFTLLELMVALGVGLMIATIVLTTVTIGLRAAQTARRMQKLHSDAIYITDQLAYWMKQSKNFVVSGSGNNTLKVTLKDDTVQTVTLQTVSGEGKIIVNGIAITNSSTNVTALSFSALAKSVLINSTLQSGTTTNQYSFRTTIAQRYAP